MYAVGICIAPLIILPKVFYAPGGQELLVVGGEEMAATVRLQHVIEVVDVRGMGSRLDGCEARVPDRGGRQTRVGAGVVGRIEVQIGFGERLRPVVLRESDGGVDASGVPSLSRL